MNINYELKITNYELKKLTPKPYPLTPSLWRYLFLVIMSVILFGCTPFPKEIENNRSVNIQLIWKITSSPSNLPSLLCREGDKFHIQANYEELTGSGVTTVVLRAESNSSQIKQASFPVSARRGGLSGLPAAIINIIAEAKDKSNNPLFRGTKQVDLTYRDVSDTIIMNKTGGYLENLTTGQGMIKGTVYSAGISTSGLRIKDKGSPLAGARVVAKGALDTRETTTKADGSFEIVVKAGCDYTLEASFANEKGAVVKYTTKVTVPTAKDPRIVDVGSLVTRRTGSIQGVVELEDGKDAEGVDIFIAGTSSVGKSHEKGRFALTAINSGTWKVVFQKAGYETAYQEVEVKSGKSSLISDKIVLKESMLKAGIKGKITNNQGQPIPGVTVTAYVLNKDELANDRPDALDNYMTTTDIDGNYELLNLPTLRDKGVKYSIQYYRTFYEYVSPVDVELLNTDMPKKMDDIQMKSNIAYFGQIRGQVVDELGKPIDAAVIWTDPQVTDQQYSDANGEFVLDRVMAGEYQLQIAAGGYCTVVMPIGLLHEKNKTVTITLPIPLKASKLSYGECVDVMDTDIRPAIPVPSTLPSAAASPSVSVALPTSVR